MSSLFERAEAARRGRRRKTVSAAPTSSEPEAVLPEKEPRPLRGEPGHLDTLTHRQKLVLAALRREGGKATNAVITRGTGYHTGHILRRLEALGLVRCLGQQGGKSAVWELVDAQD